MGMYNVVDDVIIGESESHYIVGGLSDYFYIKKDIINPAATGLYFTNETLYKSTGYNVTYAKADNSTVMDLVVSNFQTGTVAESLKVWRMADWVQFNVSNITGNSAIDTGLMKLTIDGTGVSDYFWYTAGGATLYWDDDAYGLDTAGSLYYDITTGYWDTASYSYTMKLLDETGAVIETQTVTAQSGHKDFTFHSTDFIAGETIYGVLYATDLSSGTEYTLNYATAVIMSHSEIEGYVIDALSNLPINAAWVNLTESSSVHETKSMTTGKYNITGLGSGSQWIIKTNRTGYFSDTTVMLPLSIKKYWVNISLFPTNLTPFSGAAIVGLVKEAPYNSTSIAANVYADNSTIPLDNTTTTSGAGAYWFYGQPPATLLNMSTIKSPFYRVPVWDQVNTSVLGAFVRHDMYLLRNYTLTLRIKDSSSKASLTNATVIATGSATGTYDTNLGYANITSEYGMLTVDVSATGYTPDTETYTMDADRDETMYLSKITDKSLAVIYTPHQVRYRVVDGYDQPLANSNVTAYYVADSLPSNNIEFLVNAYGIDEAIATDMVNSDVAMQGITGADGYITFTQHASLQYLMVVSNAAHSVTSWSNKVYPLDTEYILHVKENPFQSAIDDNTLAHIYNTSLWISFPNISYVRLGLNYTDTEGLTTDLRFYVYDKDNSTIYYMRDLGVPGTGQVQAWYDLPNIRGNQYLWNYTAKRS